VGRPHGLDGSFYVTRPEPFEGETVVIADVERTIVRRAGTAAKPILRVDGVDTREAIEALRGEPLLAQAGLEEGEYWAADLVGLRVTDGDTEVGVVERVRALPSCEVLVVAVTSSGDPNLRGSKDETLLIPLIDDAVRDVDLEAGVVEVDLDFLDAR
jgi:16S rRNA processing protein RimM